MSGELWKGAGKKNQKRSTTNRFEWYCDASYHSGTKWWRDKTEQDKIDEIIRKRGKEEITLPRKLSEKK